MFHEIGLIEGGGGAGGGGRGGEQVIKFVVMNFSFCNYKLYKILSDFTKCNVRYHVIIVVVKRWVDLDLVPNIGNTTITLSSHARSSLMLEATNK